jgi:predicted nuclease of restriction endonuclease-like (RecB) superfamily
MATRSSPAEGVYLGLVQDLSGLLEDARRSSARAVNAVMTSTYWEIGRRIVEFEQGGKERAEYGAELLARLAVDLTGRFGRGFSRPNLQRFREFFLQHPLGAIRSTLSSKSSEESTEAAFRLPWSHYVRLLSVENPQARRFYQTEALRGGWSVRHLDRQISTAFYERTALSRNKEAMLAKGAVPRPEDAVAANEEVRDPVVLEFLNLKDEYSESDLEEALVRHLEAFLMELGGDFAFIGRQRRLRIGNVWCRIDLLFFHRRLRSLVIIDLKIGEFSPADVGQMNVYLNYAREHWMQDGENPPVGLILALEKDEALARYALDGLGNRVLARKYRLVLPQERRLAKELQATRRKWGSRRTPV